VDIEAQDDGIVGKIFLDEKEASIDVGTVIAMLAEEGDDISSIQAPQASTSSTSEKDTSSSSSSSSKPSSSSTEDLSDHKVIEAHKSSTHVSSSPSTPGAAQMPSEGQTHGHGDPKHSMPLMPSVMRLLKEANISDASEITATGYKGRLTKGDILAHLGKIKTPLGSAQKLEDIKAKGEDRPKVAGYGASGAKQEKQGPLKSQEIVSGAEFRRWISAGLAKTEKQQQATTTLIQTPVPLVTFEDVLDGYLPRSNSAPKTAAPLPSAPKSNSWDDVLGL
jgi:pyruvate/2-oxoglutarate dehydrogenase complex dihydrolipoamide acyltransferase (E2) component